MTTTTTLCPKHAKALMEANKTLASSDSVDHSGHNLHDGMIMSFHGGYNEIILFDFWQTNSVPWFLLSCAVLFVMAALYEGLKLVREKLIRHELLKRQSSNLTDRTIPISSNCHCKHSKAKKPSPNGETNNLLGDNGVAINVNTTGGGDDEDAILNGSNNAKHDCCSKKNNEDQIVTVLSYSSRLLSQGHVLQTLLHMLQITISYLLMLVFMTYNTWLCLSVVLGAGLGYFVFGLQRLTSIDVNEHCH